MKGYLVAAIIFVAGALLFADSATPQGVVVNCPDAADGQPRLVPYDLLTAALRERGYALSRWKVRDGNALEVWDGPDAWVVVEVAPTRCAWLVVDLADEGDRLVSPPGASLADPKPLRGAVEG